MCYGQNLKKANQQTEKYKFFIIEINAILVLYVLVYVVK